MLSYLRRRLSQLGLIWIYISAICFISSLALTHDPIGSILVSTLVMAQGLIGTVLVRSIQSPAQESPDLLLISLGPGLAVGSMFSMLVFMFLNLLGLILIWATAFFVLFHSTAQSTPCGNLGSKSSETRWLIVSTMLVQYSSWSIYIKFLVVICLVASGLESRNLLSLPRIKIVQFGALALGLVISLFLPRFWWAISDDFPYFINVIKGLESFGPRDSLGQAGVGVLNWHWLTFEWLASLRPSLIGNSWTQSLVVAPMIAGASSLSSLTLVLSRCFRVATKRALTGCVLASLCMGSIVASISFRISICWLFAAIFLILNDHPRIRFPRYVLIALLTIGLIGGKPSTLPFLGAVTLVPLLWSKGSKPSVKNALVSLLIVSTTSLTYFLIFFRQSSAASNFWIAPLAHVSDQIIVDNHPTLSVLFGFVITIAVVVAAFYVARSQSNQAQQLILAGAVCFAMPNLLLDGWSDTVDYFSLPALSILAPAIVILVARDYRTKGKSNFPVLSVAGGASLGVLLKLAPGAEFVHFGSVQPQSWTAATLVFVTFSWVIWNKNSFSHLSRNFVRLSVVLASFAITMNSIPSRAELIDQLLIKRNRTDVERQLGSIEVEALGGWIDKNLPLESIFVTNYFCSGSVKCAETDWLKNQIEFIRSHPNYAIEGCHSCDLQTFLGGADFSLSAYSSRRFVLLGPRFQAGLGIPSIEIQRKILLSINSISYWSQEAASRSSTFRQDYLVAYLPFVKNLEMVKSLKSSSIFQTKNFVVVKWSNL